MGLIYKSYLYKELQRRVLKNSVSLAEFQCASAYLHVDIYVLGPQIVFFTVELNYFQVVSSCTASVKLVKFQTMYISS